MKKLFIIAFFALISVSSYAEYISVGAVVSDSGDNTYYASWSGIVQEITEVYYSLETSTGTQAIFVAYKTYSASSGDFKEGKVTLYPGCYVSLQAEVFDANPYFNTATSTIYVVEEGAIN